MELSDIAINVAFTIIFCWSMFWTFLVWGFGIHNFTRKHNKVLGAVGMALWWGLMLGHVAAIYAIWGTSYSVGLVTGCLVVAHVFYGLTFARDVSTA
ncbi:hypothetical protein [Marinobacter zhejiangensis]|uniref:Uncharacterized protein n=1 Tax=Marinobacter zhejiangensis TaxID=488535 RepID=A0A1I4T2Z7_9GAMM|nr:hypothetical protein SAMN04487963_3462 [Marinobacter zhejiangensis]